MAKKIIYYSYDKTAFVITDGAKEILIPANNSEILKGKFVDAISDSLSNAKATKKQKVDFVLSSSMYGVEFISLPPLKKTQLVDTIKTEINLRFKNADDLQFVNNELFSNDGSTFRLIYASIQLLEDLEKAFDSLGYTIDNFIPLGCAIVDGVARRDASVRRNGSVTLSFGKTKSYLTVWGDEILLGNLDIPFGLNALSDMQVFDERQLYRFDSSETVVLNAYKSASVSNFDSLLSSDDNSDVALEIDSQDGNDDGFSSLSNNDMQTHGSRALPKFLRREEPSSPNAFVLENFRLFEKRLLLLLRDISLTPYYPTISNVYLNLPKQFNFMLEQMKQDHPEYKWFSVDSSFEQIIFDGATHIGKNSSVF